MSRGRLDLDALGFTPEEAKFLHALHWVYSFRVQRADGCKTVYTIPQLGVAMSTLVPKRGKSVRTFALQGDDTIFSSLDNALRVARDRGLITRAMRESTEER